MGKKTIKVGEDAIGKPANEIHYALVVDNKVIKTGSKEDMLKLHNETKGSRVWVTSSEKGSIVEGKMSDLLIDIQQGATADELKKDYKIPLSIAKDFLKDYYAQKNNSTGKKARYKKKGTRKEEAPVNSTGAGIDMAPNSKPKKKKKPLKQWESKQYGNKNDNGVWEQGTDEIRKAYQDDTPGQSVEEYITHQQKFFKEQQNKIKKHFSQVFGNPLQNYPHNEEIEVKDTTK